MPTKWVCWFTVFSPFPPHPHNTCPVSFNLSCMHTYIHTNPLRAHTHTHLHPLSLGVYMTTTTIIHDDYGRGTLYTWQPSPRCVYHTTVIHDDRLGGVYMTTVTWQNTNLSRSDSAALITVPDHLWRVTWNFLKSDFKSVCNHNNVLASFFGKDRHNFMARARAISSLCAHVVKFLFSLWLSSWKRNVLSCQSSP